ncbi:MarR family winged helix-turn-helix transcriptional regulator [Rudaeicoccus suwonensis]|uniref:DNA-binding MarR family transcriptional regulator n=1 Tax=Rudaeicoccus suwonensis TaxID=657409 RepID=A0A561E8E4_9MICO|nr:MarR family transcriptional regulator [Rudaeicoccus suwonensis]TWE11866.1 DNA-binding MarR family transcriptional regulator [Rudaeicoccus suwonensis]
MISAADLPAPGIVDPGADPATEAWQRIRAIAHNPAAMAAFHRLVHDTGLPLAALRALLVLPVDEAIPMRDLARRLRCDTSYVTSLVDTLEKHGLASRQAHATDRRIKVIVLTPTGRRMARRAQIADNTPPEVFAQLTAREVTALRDLLRKIGAETA